MSATATLDQWIADLRRVSADLEQTMPAIAARCKAEADAVLTAGHGLGGDAWAPRKDGAPALAHAAAALTVSAVSNAIVFLIGEPYVYHHYGAGVPRRPILPRGGLPTQLGNAIRLGLVTGLSIMRGGK
jgi:hypothetical protein